MKLKLKEDPREWQKFAFVLVAFLCLVAYLLYRRRVLDEFWLYITIMELGMVLMVAALYPRWFRWPYRLAMTASHHAGQVMGKVILTIFFLLILTPMGLLLRLLGKDLLNLKRKPAAGDSYWQPARNSNQFDRLF